MSLPFNAPIQPMLSSAAEGLPAGDGWLFEPKWDGFRTLVFRDGDEILLQSRDEKPLESPDGPTRLEAEDLVVLYGPHEAIDRALRLLEPRAALAEGGA